MTVLNRVELIGRLVRDPELRHTSDGTPVCTLAVVTRERVTTADGVVDERTEEVEVVAWRRLAETCSRHLTAGRLVHIEGRVHSETREDAAGNRHLRTEVVARRMRFLARADGRPLPASEDVTLPSAE
jgi:single-strand DNA-binding protein